MSICKFIASNIPLTEFSPTHEYPGSFYLLAFDDVKSYTDKSYGVYLEWDYSDDGAKHIIEYIKAALRQTDCIEFWVVWLMDYYEYEDRPYIHRKSISIDDLTTEHIKKLNDAAIWNTPDKMYPERPSFYCLTITK